MLTIGQLATITGKTPATIRLHHRNGWLKTRTYPGVLGMRITETAARSWLRKHFPGLSFTPSPAVPAAVPVAVVERGEWMQSTLFNTAHFITAGKNACFGSPTGAKPTAWVQWHPSPDLRRCRQCMHAIQSLAQ
jgi:hypothetical protein